MPITLSTFRPLLLWAVRWAALLAASVLLTLSLLPYSAWPDTHEDLRYQFLTALFRESLAEGFWYPRWLPNLAGGYGYPTFVFYQPGFFFCAAAWMQLTGGPAAATYCTVIMFMVVGGMGAWLTGRQLGDEWSGWFCAVLLLLTPYLYVNLLVRGDLSELAAMLLAPWLLYFGIRIAGDIEASRGVSLNAGGLGLVMAAIVYCHPMVALLAAGMLAVLATCLAIQGVSWRWLSLAVVQACLVAGGLSIFYALPLVQMSRYVDFRDAISGYYTPSDHAVSPLQYLQNTWGFGGSKPGTEDGMSLQLGLPHAALAIAGLIAGWKNRVVRSLAVSYLLLVVIATTLFGWLWDIFFPLRVVQFPWRVLAVTAALQAALAAGVCRWFPTETLMRLVTCLLLTAIVVYWSLPQFTASRERNYGVDRWVQERQGELLEQSITFTGADEFRPRTAIGLRDVGPRGNRPLVEITGGRELVPGADTTPHRISYRIGPGPPAEITINQAWFPGWYVELDGKAVAPDVLQQRLTADGRISLAVESRHEQSLVAYYRGPPGGTARMAICVLLLGGFFVAWTVERRSKPAAAAAEVSRMPEDPREKKPGPKRERKARKS